MVSDVLSSCKPANRGFKDDVIVRRRGGGSVLSSRPVFSLDAKYVYLNCGWGIKVFSVKTGERVRAYNTDSDDESIVSVFLLEGQPSAITSKGKFYSWEAKSGKLLNKHRVELPKEAVVCNALLTPKLHNPESQDLCVLRHTGGSTEVSLSFVEPKHGKSVEHPLNDVMICTSTDHHSVSFGGPEDHKMIASISPKSLRIFTLNGEKNNSQIKNGITPGETREWTCVRVHPSDLPIAAGDSTGRVVIFHVPTKKGKKGTTGPRIIPPSAVYHWHTLPCRDIAFTPSGSLMFTGGGENVLVKWNVENPQIRNYLPRLSGEIVFIEVSSNFEHVAVGTLDNSVKVLDPLNRLSCSLQELAWGVVGATGGDRGGAGATLFPAGLAFDRRTSAIVLNGRPGHLQFYSPLNESLIFNIDITLQNILTQERNKVIYNTEVTGVSISSDGAWMATLETRDDPSARLEQRLKFWSYNLDEKCFTLNTSIENPHNGKAVYLRFRPEPGKLLMSKTSSLDYLLVTSGDDRKFRIWTPNDIDSVYRKGVVWGCENTCFYKHLECGPFSFSEDGTILGIGFEESLVLWDLLELKVSATLTYPSDRTRLRFVEFGQFEGFSEIICATQDSILVWNLMTLNLSWKISLNVSLLIQDTASSHFAVFTVDNDVYIFKPKSSEPVFVKENVCDRNERVLSAIFIPRLRHLSTVPVWLQDSQLFFMNSNQELSCLESEAEASEALGLVSTVAGEDSSPLTPFSSLLAGGVLGYAASSTSSKSKQKTGYGIVGHSAISQLLKHPPHTLPSSSLMCLEFVQCLCQSMKKKEDVKKDVDESDDEGVVDAGSSSDSESVKSNRSKKSSPSKVKEKKKSKNDPETAKKLAEFFKGLDEENDDLGSKPVPAETLVGGVKFVFDDAAMEY